MRIENIKIDKLKPYENNPRNNEKAVEGVAESIRRFGFKVPIVIDKNNVIVCGHTRYKASKLLDLKTIPCIRADDLTDEQIKAFRIADNSVSEVAEWDFERLQVELDEISLDMSDFGFDIEIPDWEGFEMSDKQRTQQRVRNILNLEKAQFEGVGKYDIPEILPIYELPPIREWIGFNYVLSDDEPEGKAVHFFVDDYQFERLWNEPERYAEKLSEYVCVASPDFSPYGDMPFICQVFSHYKKHWVARYLQESGVTVIPTVRCSTDKRSHDWFLDGEPKESIIVMSSMWSAKYPDEAREEYQLVKAGLNPKKIFIYGGKGNLETEGDNVEFIKNFTQKRYGGEE